VTPDELADRLEHAAMKIGPAIEKGVKHTVTLGAARIRGHASGRPGPNVISGDYRDSWQPTPVRACRTARPASSAPGNRRAAGSSSGSSAPTAWEGSTTRNPSPT
jgi:hypothetical protein